MWSALFYQQQVIKKYSDDYFIAEAILISYKKEMCRVVFKLHFQNSGKGTTERVEMRHLKI